MHRLQRSASRDCGRSDDLHRIGNWFSYNCSIICERFLKVISDRLIYRWTSSKTLAEARRGFFFWNILFLPRIDHIDHTIPIKPRGIPWFNISWSIIHVSLKRKALQRLTRQHRMAMFDLADLQVTKLSFSLSTMGIIFLTMALRKPVRTFLWTKACI